MLRVAASLPEALREPQMTGHGAKFGRKKEEAIAALLSQRNVEEAARVVGIAPKTLLRWLRVPEFKEAYRQARGEVISQATARLQQATGAAVSTLLKIMVNPDGPTPSRVRAAQCVLERAQKAFELEDLEARITQLEQRDAKEMRPSSNLKLVA
jgi:transposase-like protein